ncbi:MAG TPA: transposase, partial [Ruminococcus sp.]|nr:transposase [Ruminococcus sp.]
SSKTCSNCGNVKENLSLSDRAYHCSNCGITLNRDYNASVNIKNQGMKLVIS